MDGIVTGLTSIVPIMPDQSIITDRSGVKGPPVEIMPLPSNSFMTEDTTAELLNNPFTLSLDQDGRGSSAAGGENTVGKAAPQPGRTATDGLASTMLEEAYKLSLGNEENTPVAAELAREMSRMKSYELLGKTAARRIHQKTPESGNTGHAPAQPVDDSPAGTISDTDRSLLSRFIAPRNEITGQSAEQSGTEEGIVQTPEALPQRPGTIPDEEVRQLPLSQLGETPPADGRSDITLFSNLRGVQLSASDIEAILTLEPELRDTLLNMLSGADTGSSAAPEDIAAFMNKTMMPPAQPESIREPVDDIRKAPNDTVPARNNISDDPRAAPPGDGEPARQAAGVLAGVKTQAPALRGSIDNLRKVSELPYSLYVFGHASVSRKEDTEEDAGPGASDESKSVRKQAGKYLRLSEAIKMASVLHQIYYGGSGRFPEETPWYAPYVQYAIKSGIIQSGEFSDYNEYATRAETAYIFSNCVPKAEFPIINHITDIPDVTESIGYGDSIYLLHRAGVLTRNDRKSGFHPESMMTKAEAAAIIGRIATPSDRKRFAAGFYQ